MSVDMNRSISYIDQPNKPAFMANLLKTNNNEIIDCLSKEFLLQCSLEILRKPPIERSLIEQQLLVRCTRDIQFFKEYIEKGDLSIHSNCCKCMQHLFQTAGDVVFYKDSVGTKFYLILSGSVGVYVMLPSINDNNNQNEEDNLVLTEVKILRAGTTFGELALISKKSRAATIICKEDCNFGILEKKDFNSILKSNEEKKLIEEMNFFADLNIFQHWNFNLVKQLYLNTHSMHFIKEDNVFRENEESEAVYIIKSGEFMMLKQIHIEENAEEKNRNLERYSFDYWRKHFGGAALKYKQAELVLLTNGEMFGEEDVVLNKKRGYSIKCISPKGIVRIISKKNFIQRVLIDKTTQSLIDKMIEKKQIWFVKKIDDTKKVFQSNQTILTQNMTKDFIFNNFLKNSNEKNKNNFNEQGGKKKGLDIDKMKLTRRFRLKSSMNSQCFEAIKYPNEKEEFLKMKSDFEERQFSSSPLKNSMKVKTIKQIRVNFFMQNLPKIKTKKVIPFKSEFLESMTKNTITLQSENDAPLLKVNSYELSRIEKNKVKGVSKNLDLIKKGFKKIFFIDSTKKEKIQKYSFFFEKKDDDEKLMIKKSLSSLHERLKEKAEIKNNENMEFPKLNTHEFNKFLKKKIKNWNAKKTGSLLSRASFNQPLQVTICNDSDGLVQK